MGEKIAAYILVISMISYMLVGVVFIFVYKVNEKRHVYKNHTALAMGFSIFFLAIGCSCFVYLNSVKNDRLKVKDVLGVESSVIDCKR